jgi:SRSO17 transposase
MKFMTTRRSVMNEQQIAELAPRLVAVLKEFRPCFATGCGFEHLGTYSRGLMSDLARKSVEPMALAAGCAVRTLQEFLTVHDWDEHAVRDRLQWHVVARDMPAPGMPLDALGVIGLVDETSSVKKGTKTPGVQRQYCGAVGKIENCIVTVHLGYLHGHFKTLIDSDLFLPEGWSQDRDRCREVHIPDSVVYRAKWRISLEQLARALGHGVRFDWVVFDEYYGGKPGYLWGLDALGLHWIGEVPKNFLCWPTLPAYDSRQGPFAAKRVDNAATWGKPFRKRKWRTFHLAHQTEGPAVWKAKAGRVHLVQNGRPTLRTYWLIVAENVKTGEVKYFVSNAPPKTALRLLLRVAFQRWNVEHVFRAAKSEIGFSHYEGRNYRGLMRHLVLCQLVMLFLAEQTARLRGEKSRADARTDRPGTQRDLPVLARPPLQAIPA